MRKARKVVRDFKPQIAIGVGGYASGPTLKAAQKAGVPTLLQEQNSYAGVTNKLLASKAGRICTAYPGMEAFFPADRILLTGNPVRPALFKCTATQAEAKKSLGFDPAKPLVLVVGGSLGARTINQSIGAGIKALSQAGIQVLWQTGKQGVEKAAGEAAGVPGIKVSAFISDMATAYRAADLVVSRAGAGTISELQILGKPSVLVPSPNVAEDHQRKNAMALVQRDAAVMVLDSEAPDRLPVTIIRLMADEDRRKTLSTNILKMALPQSDEKIANAALELIENASE